MLTSFLHYVLFSTHQHFLLIPAHDASEYPTPMAYDAITKTTAPTFHYHLFSLLHHITPRPSIACTPHYIIVFPIISILYILFLSPESQDSRQCPNFKNYVTYDRQLDS